MSQLALPLRLADHAVFDSFLATGNEAVVDYLRSLTESTPGHGAWLWGAPATGKSHLLQAACERFADRAVYVPLQEIYTAGAGLLEGLGSRDLICIDDVDKIVGDDAWEQALFNLCNEVHDAGHQLVVGATSPPRESGFLLADLRSRMQRLPAFHLHVLGRRPTRRRAAVASPASRPRFARRIGALSAYAQQARHAQSLRITRQARSGGAAGAATIDDPVREKRS